MIQSDSNTSHSKTGVQIRQVVHCWYAKFCDCCITEASLEVECFGGLELNKMRVMGLAINRVSVRLRCLAVCVSE